MGVKNGPITYNPSQNHNQEISDIFILPFKMAKKKECIYERKVFVQVNFKIMAQNKKKKSRMTESPCERKTLL